MSESHQVIVGDGDADPEWDDFVAGLDHSHYEQTTCWAAVKRHQGWVPVRIKVLKGSLWCAGAQLLCRRLPLGGSVGYVPSGPFHRVRDEESSAALFGAIDRIARERRIQYLAITPYTEDTRLDRMLAQWGYRPTNEILPPRGTVRATLVLDLAKGPDALLAEMAPENRRRIRLGLKSGISVREGTRSDLPVLFRLMSMVARRRNERPAPAKVEFFNLVWDHFSPHGYVKLFVAELRGAPVSAGLVFAFGNAVRFWKFGWTGEAPEKQPNRLLYWEMIKWSQRQGYRFFDIVQVDPQVVDHLAQRRPVTAELEAHRLYGSTVFKLGFGGTMARFSGPWCRFLSPMAGFLCRRIGRALARVPVAGRLVSGIT